MTTEIVVQITPQGLFIPRAALGTWQTAELEVIQEKHRIVIRPRDLILQQERELVIQALREDGLLVEPKQMSIQPPVSPEERAELSRKLSVGRPLSEIVIEERRSGW